MNRVIIKTATDLDKTMWRALNDFVKPEFKNRGYDVQVVADTPNSFDIVVKNKKLSDMAMCELDKDDLLDIDPLKASNIVEDLLSVLDQLNPNRHHVPQRLHAIKKVQSDNINLIYPEMPGIKQELTDQEKSNLELTLKRKKYRFYNEPDGYAERMNEGLQDERNEFSGPGTENSYGGPFGSGTGRPAGW